MLKTALVMPPAASVAAGDNTGGIAENIEAVDARAPDTKKQPALPSCWESWVITNCWKKLVAVVRAWSFVPGKRVSIA